uniref:tRNA-queuosine alpha-mannosyltransferase n=1 Tax=Trichuris muris TaxID=70415 RepID=A0A5S6QMZ4_TRIMR
MNTGSQQKCLILEPFSGGSHFQMVDLLRQCFDAQCLDILTLSGRKWPWRARTAALYFFQRIPEDSSYHTVFCSSVLNLAELVALCPKLGSSLKVIYFHENQLVYPIQRNDSCDFQFSYAQIVSCIIADRIVFNSKFNRDSFLSAIPSVLHRIPKDGRPCDVVSLIEVKCTVLHFPIVFPAIPTFQRSLEELHIVWPHRWEHDKNPELFFSVLRQLVADHCNFRLSVLGETYGEAPECFQTARDDLKEQIIHWGYVPDKTAYYNVLRSSHVVVSTARHEFFGVAMLEATYLGCWPLCPDALAYQEMYPPSCRYRTPAQLCKRLRYFCKHPRLAVDKRANLTIDFSQYSWSTLKNSYADLLGLSLRNEL